MMVELSFLLPRGDEIFSDRLSEQSARVYMNLETKDSTEQNNAKEK